MNAIFNNKNLNNENDAPFEKQLASRATLISNDGKKTVGVIKPSLQTFGTADAGTMEIIKGKCEILMPKEKEWQSFTAGEKIEIPANTTFQIKVTETLNYVCHHE